MDYKFNQSMKRDGTGNLKSQGMPPVAKSTSPRLEMVSQNQVSAHQNNYQGANLTNYQIFEGTQQSQYGVGHLIDEGQFNHNQTNQQLKYGATNNEDQSHVLSQTPFPHPSYFGGQGQIPNQPPQFSFQPHLNQSQQPYPYNPANMGYSQTQQHFDGFHPHGASGSGAVHSSDFMQLFESGPYPKQNGADQSSFGGAAGYPISSQYQMNNPQHGKNQSFLNSQRDRQPGGPSSYPNQSEVPYYPKASGHQHSQQTQQNMHFENLSNSNIKGLNTLSWCSEDDEDYSINEDLQKNSKIYREDMRPFKYQIPKAEVNDLLRDTIQNNNNYSLDSILDSGPSYNSTLPHNSKKRRAPEKLQHTNSSCNLMNYEIQEPRGGVSLGMSSNMVGQDPQKRQKTVGFQQNTTGLVTQRHGSSGRTGYDHPQGFIQEGQNYNNQVFRPNTQNNFYYNFNNNFGHYGQEQNSRALQSAMPTQQYADNCGFQVSHPGSNNQALKSSGINQGGQIETKSIEIQVTPEKLGAEDGEDFPDTKCEGKKRRRKRVKKAEAKQEDVLKKNFASLGANPYAYGLGDSLMPESMKYYEQYAAAHYYQQQYQFAAANRFMNPYHHPMGPYPGYSFYGVGNVPPMPPQDPKQTPRHPSYFGFPSGVANHTSGVKQKQLGFADIYLPGLQRDKTDGQGGDSEAEKQRDDFKERKKIEEIREYFRKSFYPFKNEQLRELVSQIDMYIQIIYQTLLLDGKLKNDNNNNGLLSQKQIHANEKIKHRVYSLLYDFSSKKEQTLKHFTNLPQYEVPYLINSKEEPLRLHPQVSYFQSPLLNIAPDIMQHLQKSNIDAKGQMKFLIRYSPLINQYLLPSIYNFLPKGCWSHSNYQNHPFFKQAQQLDDSQCKSKTKDGVSSSTPLEFQIEGQPIPAPIQCQQSTNRRRFSYVDDNFLLLGLRQFGYKDVNSIQENWLLNKSANEIKHRYKNLTCAKAPDNLIKRWKLSRNMPLSESEEKKFAQALKWFGSNTHRWSLISKCFLPNRSAHFLRMEYQNIVSDHNRAERFGRLMLEEGEEQESDFEDIDLDKLHQQKEDDRRNRSLSGSSGNYEEGSLSSQMSERAGAKLLKSLIMKSDQDGKGKGENNQQDQENIEGLITSLLGQARIRKSKTLDDQEESKDARRIKNEELEFEEDEISVYDECGDLSLKVEGRGNSRENINNLKSMYQTGGGQQIPFKALDQPKQSGRGRNEDVLQIYQSTEQDDELGDLLSDANYLEFSYHQDLLEDQNFDEPLCIQESTNEYYHVDLV